MAHVLSDLLERVEGAKGPDRSIDREVMRLSYVEDTRYIGCRCDPSCCPNSAHLDHVWVDPTTDRWKTTARDGFEFTASLDAALALVERLLPGCGYTITNEHPVERQGPAAWVAIPGSPGGHATGATPALALLAAMLKALIAEDR
jgi:hypothetical protein